MSDAARPPWLDELAHAIASALAVPAECRALSREQTAAAIGISVRLLDDLGADGPPNFLLNSRRLYPASELGQWIRKQTKGK